MTVQVQWLYENCSVELVHGQQTITTNYETSTVLVLCAVSDIVCNLCVDSVQCINSKAHEWIIVIIIVIIINILCIGRL